MNPPSAVLGGGVHGKVCWLIAYYTYAKRLHSDCIESIMLVKENLSSMPNYSLPRCINFTINVS